jgi:hypothetical protein
MTGTTASPTLEAAIEHFLDWYLQKRGSLRSQVEYRQDLRLLVEVVRADGDEDPSVAALNPQVLIACQRHLEEGTRPGREGATVRPRVWAARRAALYRIRRFIGYAAEHGWLDGDLRAAIDPHRTAEDLARGWHDGLEVASQRHPNGATGSERFLLQALEPGPVPIVSLVQGAGAQGISRRQLNAARRRLGAVKLIPPLIGQWCWQLPKDRHAETEESTSDRDSAQLLTHRLGAAAAQLSTMAEALDDAVLARLARIVVAAHEAVCEHLAAPRQDELRGYPPPR